MNPVDHFKQLTDDERDTLINALLNNQGIPPTIKLVAAPAQPGQKPGKPIEQKSWPPGLVRHLNEKGEISPFSYKMLTRLLHEADPWKDDPDIQERLDELAAAKAPPPSPPTPPAGPTSRLSLAEKLELFEALRGNPVAFRQRPSKPSKEKEEGKGKKDKEGAKPAAPTIENYIPEVFLGIVDFHTGHLTPSGREIVDKMIREDPEVKDLEAVKRHLEWEALPLGKRALHARKEELYRGWTQNRDPAIAVRLIAAWRAVIMGKKTFEWGFTATEKGTLPDLDIEACKELIAEGRAPDPEKDLGLVKDTTGKWGHKLY